MEVLLHAVEVAVTPLNVILLPVGLVPNPVPVIVIGTPVFPELGFNEVRLTPVTVKFIPLLLPPPTTTITFPLVVFGTDARILVSLQLRIVA